MTAQILDGKATAAAIKSELAVRVAALKERGIVPGLGTVLVGDDPGSRWYVNGKHKDCAEVGIASIQRELPATATQQQVEDVVRELNADPTCTGYIVQLPLPKGLDQNPVLELMDPDKDADGLHPTSLGRLALGIEGPLPCTPYGIVELLHAARREAGRRRGRGGRARGHGRPLDRPAAHPAVRERHRDALSHRYPGPRQAPPAGRRHRGRPCGVGHLIKAQDVKPGAAVLDVGVSRDGEGKIQGDVEPAVAEVAGWISPNPGGVGPMTRAMLLNNIVVAAERHAGA